MGQVELYQHLLPESDQELVARIERAAEQTPARDKGLAIHVKAIEMLRAKGYSYRDIAVWFADQGIKVNHVDVWRAHRNALEADDFFDLAHQDEEWKDYLRKNQEGQTTEYSEREFDDDGNKKSPDQNTASIKAAVDQPVVSEPASMKAKWKRAPKKRS